MRARPLGVAGAVEFSTPGFDDERGSFATPFDSSIFAGTVDLFPVAQALVSRSRRGVFRGVHYTAVPPGRAKVVWCVHGRCRDIVIDVRVGSPTFARHEVVELDGTSTRALFLPAGVGHAFLALEDDTVMSYLISGPYVPANEHALDPFDPELGLDVPRDVVLSQRDRDAPTLAEARGRGLLPHYL